MKRYVILVISLALMMSYASKSNAQQASVNMEILSEFPNGTTSFNYGNAAVQTISAVVSDKEVNLSWSAKNQGAELEYIVEKSLDGEHFSAIGNRENASEAGHFSYSFSDRLSPREINQRDIYYRIGWKAGENRMAYTKPMLVRVNKTGAVKFISVFPQPVQNDINMLLSVKEDSYMAASLTDDNGREILNRAGNIDSGSKTLALTGTGNLAKGVYWLEVKVNSKEALRLRLIKE